MTEDSFTAVAARILGADPDIPVATALAAVRAAVPKEAAAARLLRALEADSSVLATGSSSMPRALQRIIVSLQAECGTSLLLPSCAHCAREMATPLVLINGSRLCATCAKRTKLQLRSCSQCGKRVLHVRRAANREYCPPCWRGLLVERVELLRVTIHDLGVPVQPESIGPALDAAAREPSAQLKTVLDLVENGAELFADPTIGSSAFARLYHALSQTNPELPILTCARCRQDRQLTMVYEGRRVCRRCYSHARQNQCAECGETRTIAQRLPDGDGICQGCRKQRPDASGVCVSCGELRSIGIRTPEGPICRSCRLEAAIDVCRKCGQRGPCRFAGTARAVCEVCRRVLHPCSRCGINRLVSTRDADGAPLCHSCTDRPPEQCIECGKQSRVVGRVDGDPLCDTCYRRHPVSFRDCVRCGNHRRVRLSGLCNHCTIRDLCEDLFPAEVVAASPAAGALRDALIANSEHRTVTAFLRPKSIHRLRTLLQDPSTLSHETIDRLGDERATMFLRSALIEYGILEAVDINLRLLEQWIQRSSEAIADATVRACYVQYATWKHLRELRTKPSPISSSLAGSRRSELKIVLHLIRWSEQRDLPLAELDQGHIDMWSMTGAERHRANGFLRWAYRNRLARPLYLSPRRNRNPVLGGLSDEARAQLLSRVLRDSDVAAGTKLAAALILLYGIQPHRIMRIELSQLGSEGDLATIRMGSEVLHLPEELNLITEAASAARRAHRLLHSVEDTRWLFPGSRPGYPMSATTMTRRLYKIGFPVADARKGAIISLARDVHPVVLADLTGIHIRTAIWWREAIAASRARYVGQLLAESEEN